ncbi:MAG: glycine/sarcosine/betaine reductase component B subunit [Acutalibacteraceae bacterium]
MKLTLNKFHVQDIQFAEASSFQAGVLYINKAELAEYLMEDTNIRSVDFDIARPGESVRIVPIKDVVQPRFKQERLRTGISRICRRCGNGWKWGNECAGRLRGCHLRKNCGIPGRYH